MTTSQEISADTMVERHQAVHRYDPERGIAFSSFAQPTILGELRHHFRDHTWAMRVPRRLQEVSLALDGATPGLTAALGRRPTAADSQVHVSRVLRRSMARLREAADGGG